MTGPIIPILQTAIGPMILISGIGLLLLTMTNRLGRAVDRARATTPRAASDPAARGQLSILLRRARLLQLAILFASASSLCAALLIIALFLSALAAVSVDWLLVALFVAGMVSLIASLVLFMRDVNLSLDALHVETTPHK